MIMVDPRVTDFDDADVSDPALDARAVETIAVDALAIDPLVVDAPVVDPTAVDALVVDLEPEPRRHLRVAPDSVKRRRHVRIAAAAAVVSISATLFAVVGFNVELAQHQIQLQKLQVEVQAEQLTYYDLRARVAQSSSPSVISHEAARLGMIKASPTYLAAPIPPPPADSTTP